MKTSILFLFILTGCFQFEKSEIFVAEYKLGNSQSIKAYSIGTGATTKDRVEIRLQSSKNELLIKKIEGFGTNYKTDIIRVNDTLFKIRFTDTLVFKGHINDFNFSINFR